MTESHNNDKLLNQVKSTLDAAAEGIDGATKTRLRSIRRDALASSEKQNWNAWWVPAGSLAAVATITVLIVSLLPATSDESVFMPPLEDIALLSDKADLEFYQDLDFYLWLDSEQINNNERLKREKLSNEQQTG